MSNNSLASFKDSAIADTPVAPGIAIGAIALQLAMQYHDATVVKDGVMYQQMKMEGKNFSTIGLSDVFDTAKAIEIHLLGTSDRIAGIVVDAIERGSTSEDERIGLLKEFIKDAQTAGIGGWLSEEESETYGKEYTDLLQTMTEHDAAMVIFDHIGLGHFSLTEEEMIEHVSDEERSIVSKAISTFFECEQ